MESSLFKSALPPFPFSSPYQGPLAYKKIGMEVVFTGVLRIYKQVTVLSSGGEPLLLSKGRGSYRFVFTYLP